MVCGVQATDLQYYDACTPWGKRSPLDQTTNIKKGDFGEPQIICQIILLDRILGKLKSASNKSQPLKVSSYEVHPLKQAQEDQMDLRHLPLGCCAPQSLLYQQSRQRVTYRFISLGFVLQEDHNFHPFLGCKRSPFGAWYWIAHLDDGMSMT